MSKNLIITTSWDDGHPLDIRIAELLEKYNLQGTFYVPFNNAENVVMKEDLLKTISQKFEIGGHTVNHIYLDKLDYKEAKYEVSVCKERLQELLGKEIYSFCYPGGKFSERDRRLVREAGFMFGRTTRLLHTNNNYQQGLMDTSVQAYHHSVFTLASHCVKHLYISPLMNMMQLVKGNRSFPALIDVYLDRMLGSSGVFHLWGHSWEIDRFNLWNDLESVFNILSKRQDALFLNNTDSWRKNVR